MPFKMKGFSGFKSSPMKKSMGPTEDKIAFEKPAQKKTKKQVRQENRAERKATRKSEGSVARQALRRGINKVKSKTSNVRNTVKLAASDVAQKFKKKKGPAVAQPSRKIQAPKASNPGVVKPTVKKTIKKVQTKRGTGNTYKAVWDADKGNVKSKYKNFEAFRKAAVAYNKKKDIEKGYKRKEGTQGPTQPYPGDKK